MTKAIVIKTVGDQDYGEAIAGAIYDNVSQRVIRLDEGELATVKAELARYKGRIAIRACGDEKRLKRARKEMAKKYSTKPVGRATGAFLGLYGLVCLWVATAYEKLAIWNRG